MQLHPPPPLTALREHGAGADPVMSPALATRDGLKLQYPPYFSRKTVSMPQLRESADAHFSCTFAKALSPEKRVSPNRLRLSHEDRFHDDLARLETFVDESRLPPVFSQATSMYSQVFVAIADREAAEWSVLVDRTQLFFNRCSIGSAIEYAISHEAWTRRCIHHVFEQNAELLAWFAECLFSMLKLWREWSFVHDRITIFAKLQHQFYSECLSLEQEYVSCTPPTVCKHLAWTRCVRSHSTLLAHVPTSATCHFSNCVMSQRCAVIDDPMLATHKRFLQHCREQLAVLDEMDMVLSHLHDEEQTIYSRLQAYGGYLNNQAKRDENSSNWTSVLSQVTFSKVMFHGKREGIERAWISCRLLHPFQQEALAELEALNRCALREEWHQFAVGTVLATSEQIHRRCLESSYPGPLLPLWALEISQRRAVEQRGSSGWSQLFVNCHGIACLHRLELLRRRETLLLAARVWQSICETFRSTQRTLCGAHLQQQQSVLQRDLLTADMQGRVDYFMIAETKARNVVSGLESAERGAFEFLAAQLLHRAMIDACALYRNEVVGRELLYRVIATERAGRSSIVREEAHMRSLFAASLRPLSFSFVTSKATRPLVPHRPSTRPLPSTNQRGGKTLLVDENSMFSLVSALSAFLPADEALTIMT